MAKWLLLVWCPLIAEVDTRAADHESPVERRRAKIRETLRTLRTPIASFSANSSFEKVLQESFVEEHDLDVVVNWDAIIQAGVAARDSEVLLAVEVTTVGEILDAMLKTLSAGPRNADHALTYHIIGGKVKISTRADFKRFLFTKAYHLNDLKQLWLVDGLGNDLDEPDDALRSEAQTKLPRRQVSGPCCGVSYERYEPRIESLIIRLWESNPASWDVNGGRGTITPFADKVVITQTLDMHELIGGQRFVYVAHFLPRNDKK